MLSASFRDPSGRVVVHQGRVLRLMNPEGYTTLSTFVQSDVARRLSESGRIVRTELLAEHATLDVLRSLDLLQFASEFEQESVVEHERIPFCAYPYEWPPEMLYAAGNLTLDLAEQCLEEGRGLKDATPYNIVFRGADPVFVDLLSFENRNPLDPTWLAYAQFVRNFILPLLAERHLHIPLDQIFRTRRDGITPREIYGVLGPLRRVFPAFLRQVTLPVWLSKFTQQDTYKLHLVNDPEKAKFILKALFRSLRAALRRVAPQPRESAWSGYVEEQPSYTDEQIRVKSNFVEQALLRMAPSRVLDVGCNTGIFSTMAAQRGSEVVAVDKDPVVVGRLWSQAASENLNILPLVLDIARPSPSLGWRNQENSAFLERASGHFDMVLMLSLVHHLMVSERVPLDEIIELAYELTTKAAVIEYIAPEDPMFRLLARGRDHLHASLNRSAFEDALRRRFDVVEWLPNATRALYLLRRKGLPSV